MTKILNPKSFLKMENLRSVVERCQGGNEAVFLRKGVSDHILIQTSCGQWAHETACVDYRFLQKKRHYLYLAKLNTIFCCLRQTTRWHPPPFHFEKLSRPVLTCTKTGKGTTSISKSEGSRLDYRLQISLLWCTESGMALPLDKVIQSPHVTSGERNQLFLLGLLMRAVCTI